MLLIGFGHKARQGKNTAAVEFINQAELETTARIFAFSDALRAEVNKLCREYGGAEQLINVWHEVPLRGVLMPAWVKPEVGKMRSLLQWYGTDYRRAEDPAYWITKLDAALKAAGQDIALVTDVRFPDEAAYIKAAGGYLVKCTRTTKPDIKVREHESEKALDGYTGWDYEIKTGTLADCHKQAAAIYRQIAGKL